MKALPVDRTFDPLSNEMHTHETQFWPKCHKNTIALKQRYVPEIDISLLFTYKT